MREVRRPTLWCVVPVLTLGQSESDGRTGDHGHHVLVRGLGRLHVHVEALQEKKKKSRRVSELCWKELRKKQKLACTADRALRATGAGSKLCGFGTMRSIEI